MNWKTSLLLLTLSYLSADEPIRSDGSALFYYVNQSGVTDDEVFLQIFGVDPATGIQCFIEYDENGIPSYYDVSKVVDSKQFSYPVSYFPLKEGGRELYLPMLDGARIFTSIQEKLSLLVSKNAAGVWTISSPDPLNPNDPNRDFLWDKTEFAVNRSAIFINPTAVDSFALPLHCEERGKDGTVQSGGLQENREVIFQALHEAFTEDYWPHLLSEKPSLVYAPMFGAATNLIPNNLFVTSGWIEAFQTLFSQSPLLIDAEESLPVSQGGGIWKGLIDVETNVITFEREVDPNHPPVAAVSITLPMNANELLGGNGPSWKIDGANPLQNVFARDIACAIDTNTLTTEEPLNQNYFKKVRPSFYQLNPNLPEKLQFIDLYSKILHSYGNHDVYTLPYDDELGQSGAASYVPENYLSGTITLGPLG